MIKDYINKNGNSKIIVSDIRFQNEIDSLINTFRPNYNCKFIRVKRSCENFVDLHDSERFIDELKYIDCEIDNNGTLEQLHEKIDRVFCLY